MTWWSCWRVRQHLNAYMDGEMSLSDHQAIHRHTLRCPACQREVQALEELRRLLKAEASEQELPDGRWKAFWPQVRDRIVAAERPEPAPWWSRWAWAFARPPLAIGSAAVAVALLLLVLWHGVDQVGAPTKVALQSIEETALSITVHSVESQSPGSSVMVYSNNEKNVTVIWVFGLDRS